jgi:hypothetical protein
MFCKNLTPYFARVVEEVGNNIFVTKDATGLSLDGAKHSSEVPRGQGPLLADYKGPEINFWPFPRGSD